MSAGAVWYAAAILLAAAGGVEDEVKLCGRISDAAARLACYDSLAGRTPEAAAPAAADVEKFGLPPQPDKKEAEISSIRSRLRGEFGGWEPGAMFTLENGQVWKCVGDDRAFYPDVSANPEVVISKSYLGAYWMEITAIGRKVKVKRVK
jgi:hypothetical protein